MVKNLSCNNAEKTGSIPGQEIEVPHATGLLSPCTAMKTQHRLSKWVKESLHLFLGFFSSKNNQWL